MSKKLYDALKNVRDILQEEESEHCVAVEIFISEHGYNIDRVLRSPGSLKRQGISMRNLKGDWIR